MNVLNIFPSYRAATQQVATLEKERDQVFAAIGVTADSGLTIDELLRKFHRIGTAESLTAVYRSIALISSAVASLPLEVFEVDAEGYSIPVRDDPVLQLLRTEPAPLFNSATFWEYITASTLFEGDAYAVIDTDRNGNITALLPMISSGADVRLNPDTGRLAYRFTSHTGKTLHCDQSRVLHFTGDMFDGIKSRTPIQACSGAIKLGQAAEGFADDFFTSGGKPPVWIEVPGGIDKDQTLSLQQFWLDHTQKGKPGVLKNGAKAHELKINNADAQLLESRKFQLEEVARMFGVPLWMLSAGDKSSNWGTGISEQMTGFVMFAIEPRNNRFEAELNRKIFAKQGRQARFAVAELLRGDPKTQAEYFSKALGGSTAPGWMSQNDVRRSLHLSKDPVASSNELSNAFNKGQPHV